MPRPGSRFLILMTLTVSCYLLPTVATGQGLILTPNAAEPGEQVTISSDQLIENDFIVTMQLLWPTVDGHQVISARQDFIVDGEPFTVEVPAGATSDNVLLDVDGTIEFAPFTALVPSHQYTISQGRQVRRAFLGEITNAANITINTPPAHGVLTIEDEGSTVYTYVPHPAFFGTDAFAVVVEEASGLTHNVTASVTVEEDGGITSLDVSPSPILPGNTLTIVVQLSGAWNQTASAQEVAQVKSVELPGIGVVAFTDEGNVTGAGFASTHTVSVVVPDGAGSGDVTVHAGPLGSGVTSTAQVGYLVQYPVDFDQTLSVLRGRPANGVLIPDALANQSVTVSLAPEHGSVTIDDISTGSFAYTPEPAFVGQDSFRHVVTTAEGFVYPVTITVDVQPYNSIVSVDIPVGTHELGSTLEITVSMQGDWDQALQGLTYATVASVSLPGAGDVSFERVSFAQGANFASTEVLQLTVSSGAITGDVLVGAAIQDATEATSTATAALEIALSQYPIAVYDDGSTRIYRRHSDYPGINGATHDGDSHVDEGLPWYDPDGFLADAEDLGLLLTYENMNTSPYFEIPGYPTTLEYQSPDGVLHGDGFALAATEMSIKNTAESHQRFYGAIFSGPVQGGTRQITVTFDEPVQAFGFVLHGLPEHTFALPDGIIVENTPFDIQLPSGAVARRLNEGRSTSSFYGIVAHEPFDTFTMSMSNLTAWRGFYLGQIPAVGPITPGSQQAGADYTGAEFSHQILSTAQAPTDLSGADLSTASLRRARLHAADLRNASLTGTDLLNADFAGADLRGTNLTEAALFPFAHYVGANLAGLNLADAPMLGADLDGADLTDVVFSGADLTYARLRGADLRRADLTDADLYQAQMKGADLRETNLQLAARFKATYTDADLSGLDLTGADFSPILRSPYSMRVSFDGATLVGTSLHNANLSFARFNNADLRGADLGGAQLTDTVGQLYDPVDSMRVEPAAATFSGAVYDQFTEFPDGFDPAAEGMVFVERPAPVAAADVAQITIGASVTIDVLSNDEASEGVLDPSSVALLSSPSGGTVSVDQETGAITYTPASGFVGMDGFTYAVSDNAGLVSNTATVTIEVMSTPPTLTIQDISAVRGKKFTVPIRLNATFGVIAATFKVAYDPATLVIREQDVRSTDLSDGMVVVTDVKQNNGSLAISLAGPAPLSAGGGILVEVPVTVRTSTVPGDVLLLSFVSGTVIVEPPGGGLDVILPALENGTVNVFAPGDPNGDGFVDLQDAIFILRSMGSIQDLTEAQLLLADADGNGLINIDDAVFVVRSLTSARPLAGMAGAVLETVAVLLEARENGDEVRVPVVLDGHGGIVGMDVSLQVDPTHFALESVELASPDQGMVRWDEDGRVRLTGLSLTGMGGTEPVAELVLRRLTASEAPPVQLTEARLVALSGDVFPVVDSREVLPKAFALLPTYPNPFNPETVIRYQLPSEMAVTVTIYDALGQRLETLERDTKAAGTHLVPWGAGDRAPGLYFAVVEAGGFRQSTKMMLVK
jgi:uncharacterized protein YjbI with pentapeptide repeats